MQPDYIHYNVWLLDYFKNQEKSVFKFISFIFL